MAPCRTHAYRCATAAGKRRPSRSEAGAVRPEDQAEVGALYLGYPFDRVLLDKAHAPIMEPILCARDREIVLRERFFENRLRVQKVRNFAHAR